MAKRNTIAYCGRCQRDTCHRRGRRCHWHCLVCGTEHIRLTTTGKTTAGLPPGFFLEKKADGELSLYAAAPVAKGGNGKNKVMHYLKGVFPSDATRRDIESHAWEIYMSLKKEPDHD